MDELLLEPLAELVGTALYLLVAVAFTGAGLVAESLGVSTLSAGQSGLGLWYLFMGALGLYVGVYLIGYNELVARLTAS